MGCCAPPYPLARWPLTVEAPAFGRVPLAVDYVDMAGTPRVIAIGESTTQNGGWLADAQAVLPGLVQVGTRTAVVGAAWLASTTYARDDIVTRTGVMFVAQGASTGVDPLNGSGEWADAYAGEWSAGAYQIGAIVTHGNSLYSSDTDANTDEPPLNWTEYTTRHEAVRGRTAVWFGSDANSRLTAGMGVYLSTYGLEADAVVIMLGINDCYSGEPVEDTIAVLSDLVTTGVAAGLDILVVPVIPPSPDISAWGYPLPRETYEDRRAALNIEIEQLGVRTIPLEYVLTEAAHYDNALHPSNAGDELIGKMIAAELAAL